MQQSSADGNGVETQRVDEAVQWGATTVTDPKESFSFHASEHTDDALHDVHGGWGCDDVATTK